MNPAVVEYAAKRWTISVGVDRMIQAIAADILRCQPHRVRHVTYDGFFSFVWGGDGWSIAVTSPWRVRRGRDLITSADSESAPDDVWMLVGHDLVAVEQRSALTDIDPRFIFDGDITMDVFTDNFVDPWVVHLNGSIYVADGVSESSLGASPEAIDRAGRPFAGGRVTAVRPADGRLILRVGEVDFTLPPPWRVARNGTLIVSSDMSARYAELNGLVGLSLERVVDDGRSLDACLVLSGGTVIESLSMLQVPG